MAPSLPIETPQESGNGDVTAHRTGPEPYEHGRHQPVNTAREKQERQVWYRDTGQGIRGRNTR